VKTGELIKTLDAHFGRIIGMRSVVNMDANKVVSASIDKSIKIWNFNNILEDNFSIARHEKPIDQLSLASHAYIGATTTRNCVGIWNLESGKLEKTLRQSGSAIVTHAAITPDAQFVVAADSGSIMCWDVDNAKV
jgi:WD40 repeat protein